MFETTKTIKNKELVLIISNLNIKISNIKKDKYHIC